MSRLGTVLVLALLLGTACGSTPSRTAATDPSPASCPAGVLCLHVAVSGAWRGTGDQLAPATADRASGCITFLTGDQRSVALKFYVLVGGVPWGLWAVVSNYKGPGDYPGGNSVQFFHPDFSASYAGDGEISVGSGGRSGFVLADLANDNRTGKPIVLKAYFGCDTLQQQ